MQSKGHALMLHGPSGLGQFELATQLAKAWLCEQALVGGACGQCASCHSFDVHTHGDFQALMPETEALARGWPLSDAAQAELDGKKRKPSKEIRVDAMREVVLFSQRTAGTPRGKVVLVYPAERMNAIAANTLLKTLEEPPGALRFILATGAAHDLLPTVRSRCVGHALGWPTTAQSVEWLAQQGLPAQDASVLLKASGGRPLDALALHQSGLGAPLWRAFPKAVAKGDMAVMQAFSAAEALETFQKLCNDLTRQAFGAAPIYFDAQNLPPSPPGAVLLAWSKSLQAAVPTIEHPFGLGLLHESLMAQAQQVLAPRDGPAVATKSVVRAP
jgi:DNA polymerase III subunit delta'